MGRLKHKFPQLRGNVAKGGNITKDRNVTKGCNVSHKKAVTSHVYMILRRFLYQRPVMSQKAVTL